MAYTPIDYSSDMNEILKNTVQELKRFTSDSRVFSSFEEARTYTEVVAKHLISVKYLREMAGEAAEGARFSAFTKQGK